MKKSSVLYQYQHKHTQLNLLLFEYIFKLFLTQIWPVTYMFIKEAQTFITVITQYVKRINTKKARI